jgi:hypothetical protein
MERWKSVLTLFMTMSLIVSVYILICVGISQI